MGYCCFNSSYCWVGEVILMVMSRSQMSKQITKPPRKKKWSMKRKKKINCARPKGFSEKAYCAGRKKRK